ncbi:MAG TPA: hypothetical protein VH142_01165 [Polyangiaceae bacterium]|jgi:hypothetical protein|nr:hypothetical protein [Polyangiaceae bacterium]
MHAPTPPQFAGGQLRKQSKAAETIRRGALVVMVALGAGGAALCLREYRARHASVNADAAASSAPFTRATAAGDPANADDRAATDGDEDDSFSPAELERRLDRLERDIEAKPAENAPSPATKPGSTSRLDVGRAQRNR